MRNLSELTSEECQEIARIINPDVNWKIIVSKNTWNGFDLIDGENESDFTKCVQIDYNPNIAFEERFRYYEDLYEYDCQSVLTTIKLYLNYIEVSCD